MIGKTPVNKPDGREGRSDSNFFFILKSWVNERVGMIFFSIICLLDNNNVHYFQ